MKFRLKEKTRRQGTKKIRKGDKVVAIAGDDIGQTGTVLSVDGDRAVVQGLRIQKRHVKKSQDAPKGRIVDMEQPIHVSNLKVCVDGDTAKKLKVNRNEQGQRQLVYTDEGQEVVYRSVKKPK